MDLTKTVTVITILTNLAGIYPIMGLCEHERYYGSILVTISMLMSMLHHISFTSEKHKIKGLLLSEYSSTFLSLDKFFAVDAFTYGLYLLSLDFRYDKLIIPLIALFVSLLGSLVLPNTIYSDRIHGIICKFLLSNKIDNNIKLIIFAILHNIWHVLGFIGLFMVIPNWSTKIWLFRSVRIIFMSLRFGLHAYSIVKQNQREFRYSINEFRYTYTTQLLEDPKVNFTEKLRKIETS